MAQKALYFDYCFPVMLLPKAVSLWGAYFRNPGTSLLIFVSSSRNTGGWELNLILAETYVVKSFKLFGLNFVQNKISHIKWWV